MLEKLAGVPGGKTGADYRVIVESRISGESLSDTVDRFVHFKRELGKMNRPEAVCRAFLRTQNALRTRQVARDDLDRAIINYLANVAIGEPPERASFAPPSVAGAARIVRSLTGVRIGGIWLPYRRA